MMKFYRKQIKVEACRWHDRTSGYPKAIWRAIKKHKIYSERYSYPDCTKWFIQTPEGVKELNIGDWIVLQNGHLYLRKNEDFVKEYELPCCLMPESFKEDWNAPGMEVYDEL